MYIYIQAVVIRIRSFPIQFSGNMAAKLRLLAVVALLLSAPASIGRPLETGTVDGNTIDVRSLEDSVTNMKLNKGRPGSGAAPLGNSKNDQPVS